jgi:hypothetical protein
VLKKNQGSVQKRNPKRQQDESMDSVRQESQLYIAEDNKDADGSVDSVRRRESIIYTHT